MGSKIHAIDINKIDRLNDINYSAWKRRISYLSIHDKTHYVVFIPKTSYDRLETQEDYRRKKKWKEDDLAKAIIRSHISDHLIPFYENFESVGEILNMLDIKFGSKLYTMYNFNYKNIIECTWGKDPK